LIRQLITDSWQKANLLTVMLWPLSLIYRAAFALNKNLYRVGLKSIYRAPVPLIVVGNLTVGGTGKTPIVIYLIEQLRLHGYTPGVISRGYHGNTVEGVQSVKPDTPIIESGDEPAMLMRRTKAPIVIGANRQAACEMLLDEFSVDVIVSDDGLQHHALARDVEICLRDMTTPQTNHYLLPAGPYREPRTRFETIDLLVTHQPATNEFNGELSSNTGGIDKEFTMYLDASAPISVNSFAGNGSTANGFDTNKLTHAVAGIANPQRFFDTCRSLGYTIEEHGFADHHAFSASDLNFGEAAQVLMTEKDAVKCVNFNNASFWFLPVNAKLENGFIDAVLKKLDS